VSCLGRARGTRRHTPTMLPRLCQQTRPLPCAASAAPGARSRRRQARPFYTSRLLAAELYRAPLPLTLYGAARDGAAPRVVQSALLALWSCGAAGIGQQQAADTRGSTEPVPGCSNSHDKKLPPPPPRQAPHRTVHALAQLAQAQPPRCSRCAGVDEAPSGGSLASCCAGPLAVGRAWPLAAGRDTCAAGRARGASSACVRGAAKGAGTGRGPSAP
jgi:hypothetical protein